MYLDDGLSEVITMNYLDTVQCNGSTPADLAARMSSSFATSSSLAATTAAAASATASATCSNLNWLIYTFYSRQEYGICGRLIEQQLRQHADKEYAYLVKGLIARKQGEVTESLMALQQAINLNPANATNFKEMGRTLQKLGRFRHAMDAFRRAESIAARPDSEVFHCIGELLLRQAEHALEAHNNRSKRAIAGTKAEAGGQQQQQQQLPPLRADSTKLDEAKQYFLQAVQHDARQVESLRKLSAIYVREVDYPRAIEMLESIVQISPENVEVLSDLGCLYLHLGDTKNGFDRLIQVTKLNDQHSKALMALGAIMQSKNDSDGALNRYKLINVAVADSCELWSNIGLCFLSKRKFVAAIACLKKSVWMAPLNFNCVFNLGIALLVAQQFASAYYAFTVAANLCPNHAESLMLIGICLRSLRDAGNAAMAFERATLLPEALTNPLIYLNFAVFCNEMGQQKAAKEAVDNVVRMKETVALRKDYAKVLATLQQRLAEFEQQPEEASPEAGAEFDVGDLV